MSHDTTTTESTPAPEAGDPRAVFARAVALAAAVIDAVPPGRLGDPTPSGMAVDDLLEHLVMVLRRVACAGRGDDPGTWPIDAADVAPGGHAAAWRDAAHEVQSAWTDPAVLERPTRLPWGTFSGAETLGVYTNEVTVHTWDLARGTDQSPPWDEAVVAVADAAIHAHLPDADRTALWAAVAAGLPGEVEWQDPFANAVEVPDTAPPIDRLVAWNGRQP